MAVILGINAYHPDAAACVLVDGELKAATAEERLTRVKHASGFPTHAIQKALSWAGVSIEDVEWLAVGHDSNANLRQKALRVLTHPMRSANTVAAHLKRRRNLASLNEILADACGYPVDQCRFKVQNVEHHLAHVASSFFASDFEEAAGFAYDGAGDFVSGLYARCHGNQIEVLDKVFMPHSLGYFYTGFCQFLGFRRFGEEYKVMGLSAFGEPSRLDLMREVLTISGSQYRLNPAYIQGIGNQGIEDCATAKGEVEIPTMYRPALVQRLGLPREPGTEFSQRDLDVAASVQRHFEEVVLQCLDWLHERVPTANLVTAGGCALNGVCNGRILRDAPFKETYIHGAASDDGTAVGAALYLWHQVLGNPRRQPIHHAYFGGGATDEEIENAIRKAGLPFVKLLQNELLEAVADRLNRGEVVGWFQGRSEWGPRALGNRSLLAHPGWPGMKDLINQKIKRRESFRPFAPSILAEEVQSYFEQDIESPFMMHVVEIRPEKRDQLSAVCHEDGTGRLHTVRREDNPLYYDLIRAFQARSGIPVLLNTSFNENEPIVETPEEAIACFLRNDIDALCIGPFLVARDRLGQSPEMVYSTA